MASSTASRSIAQLLPLRIVLLQPPPGVTYGVQRGKGSSYDVDFAQTPKRGDVTFEFAIAVVRGKSGQPDFRGDHVQGPAGRRFIYVDVGQYAKQHSTPWARRMIVRLDEISWPQIDVATKAGNRLEARIEGTGKDGGPNCATVRPLGGWRAVP